MYQGHRIIDGHVHYTGALDPERFVGFLDGSGTDSANLAVITRGKTIPDTAGALALKAMYPGRFTVFGALDPREYYRGGDAMGSRHAERATELLRCGCDGIKLLEGKPQLRRAFPIPDFDAPCWEAFWRSMEETQTPVLMHVNDPASFWDREHIPSWARRMGWYYDDSYINNEAQYAQLLTVLSRHPGLRICFAHFFFLSESLDRLGDILSKYESVRVDLTPGIELYEALSNTPERTRDFFAAFRGRILYGTDIGSRYVYGNRGKEFDGAENARRHEIVREFILGTEESLLRCDGHFVHDRPDFLLRPLGYAGDDADGLFSRAFLSFAGETPRPVDVDRSLYDCRRMLAAQDEWAAVGMKRDDAGLTLTERRLSRMSTGNGYREDWQYVNT